MPRRRIYLTMPALIEVRGRTIPYPQGFATVPEDDTETVAAFQELVDFPGEHRGYWEDEIPADLIFGELDPSKVDIPASALTGNMDLGIASLLKAGVIALLTAGSAAAPAYGFEGAPGSGMYVDGSGRLQFANLGEARLRFDGDGVAWFGGLMSGSHGDGLVVTARTVTGAGNAHAYVDLTTFSKNAGLAYNSFDAKVTIAAVTRDYDHINGFQFRPTFNQTGTFDRVIGNSVSISNLGANAYINHYAGLRMRTNGLGGRVTNIYGMWLPDAATGTELNYAVFAPDASWNALIGGALELGGDLAAGGNVRIGPGDPLSSHRLVVRHNGVNARMRIERTGNNAVWDLGIGSLSGAGSTQGTASYMAYRRTDDDSEFYIRNRRDGQNATLIARTDGLIRLPYYNAAGIMAVDASGNMIGGSLSSGGNGTVIRIPGINIQIAFFRRNMGSRSANGAGTFTNPYRSNVANWTYQSPFSAAPVVAAMPDIGAAGGVRWVTVASDPPGASSVNNLQLSQLGDTPGSGDAFVNLIAIGPYTP